MVGNPIREKGASDAVSIQRLKNNHWVVLVVPCLGLFMALLDTTPSDTDLA